MYVQTKTFEISPDHQVELEVLALAIDYLVRGRHQDALDVLMKRHDSLTIAAPLKLYDQREVMR